MTTNKEGRAGWHQATPKTSESTCNSTSLSPRVIGFIVILALWGWLCVGLANQLIHCGETHND